MSRAGTGGDQVISVAPTNNIYTVLVITAVVVEIIGFVALIMQAGKLFPGGASLF